MGNAQDSPEYGHTAGTQAAQPPAKTGANGGAQDRASRGRALPRRLYALPDAAGYLGVSVRTVRELIWRGELPQVRIARRVLVDLKDLDAYIASQKTTFR